MFSLIEDPKYKSRNLNQTRRGGSWPVYRRLLSYALRYKGRLAVSVLFALVVAISFSAMILGVAGIVQVVFGPEDAVFDGVRAASGRISSSTPLFLREALLRLPWPEASSESSDAPVAVEIVIRQGSHEQRHTLPDIAPSLPDSVKALIDATVQADKTDSSIRIDADSVDARIEERLIAMAGVMRQRKMPALVIGCSIILVLVFFAGIARYFQEYFAGLIGAGISVQLAREMVENILRCSLRFYEQHPTGEILARLTNDVFRVNQGLANVFVKLIREPFKMLFFLVIAIKADPALTLIGLCVLPPVAAVILKLGKRFKRSVKRSLEKIASLAAMGSEIFSGIIIVKGFCMEPYELRRIDGELAKLRSYLVKMVKADALVGPLVEIVLIGGVSGFVVFLGYRVDAGMDPGRLVELVVALAFILDPVRKLSSVNNMIMGSVASAERVFEFIDVQPDVAEKPTAVVLPPLRETIRLDDVRFSYDGQREVINGISVEIRKGEMIALVGFSGSGKSTLAKLIPRFYDITSGSIRVDGVDIRDATLESLRSQISIVTQETVLFDETVRKLIAFGREDFTEERIRQAAQAAHAEDFISRLSSGLDTRLGEGGGSLSGGQRQRLAIARAIIKDPSILILDEATSSLDSESERAIQQAIDQFVVGRTTIVIAHRLSTILRADRIIVLDEGRIAESGTHADLLARDGIYKRLYDNQFGLIGDGNP